MDHSMRGRIPTYVHITCRRFNCDTPELRGQNRASFRDAAAAADAVVLLSCHGMFVLVRVRARIFLTAKRAVT